MNEENCLETVVKFIAKSRMKRGYKVDTERQKENEMLCRAIEYVIGELEKARESEKYLYECYQDIGNLYFNQMERIEKAISVLEGNDYGTENNSTKYKGNYNKKAKKSKKCKGRCNNS